MLMSLLFGAAGIWLGITLLGVLPLLSIWKSTPQQVSEEKARESLQTALASGKVQRSMGNRKSVRTSRRMGVKVGYVLAHHRRLETP